MGLDCVPALAQGRILLFCPCDVFLPVPIVYSALVDFVSALVTFSQPFRILFLPLLSFLRPCVTGGYEE